MKSDNKRKSRPGETEFNTTRQQKQWKPSQSPISTSITTTTPFRAFEIIPNELVDEITNYLRRTDKMCLALACKSLFYNVVFAKVLRRKFRKLNNQLHRSYICPGVSSILHKERWRLLKRLENDSWKCCVGCLKLHPGKQFDAENFLTPANERHCMFGLKFSVINLCPCKTMTVRDKNKMIRELVAALSARDAGKDIETALQCWHECMYTYGSAKVAVKITRKLRPMGELVLGFEYSIAGTDDFFPNTLFDGCVCPHWTLQTIILAYSPKYNFDCCECETLVTDITWGWDGGAGRACQFSFRTERCLGRDAMVVTKEWAQQKTV
ncbi:hypothetical protein GX50_01008 [[Emmonsia] crescens]|uniref:F-box domain-containing protein n=1 Tax=[Emmonsia] crescens TaxID=73230 RepID=A0A2B7ZSH7_9EURO|nr:hypothetical protein GX50_01008 [Emmonsia crescens]